jgi:hypothetical protein
MGVRIRIEVCGQLPGSEQIGFRRAIRGAHLQVKEHAARDMLAGTSLREEGVEGVVAAADGLVARHLAIRLNA